MPHVSWFLFDLGNVVVSLAYERVLAELCREADVDRDVLVEIMEAPGGYRDMERGALSFPEFHSFLVRRARYRGDLARFRAVWSDFFVGPVDGIEELLGEVRGRYRVAFLSNTNAVHASVIPVRFASLFRSDDRFIFSHLLRTAKPDAEFFRRALELLGTLPDHVVFIDDLLENVVSARNVGIQSFQFTDVVRLREDLAKAGLL